jgi:hypothetical protein
MSISNFSKGEEEYVSPPVEAVRELGKQNLGCLLSIFYVPF